MQNNPNDRPVCICGYGPDPLLALLRKLAEAERKLEEEAQQKVKEQQRIM